VKANSRGSKRSAIVTAAAGGSGGAAARAFAQSGYRVLLVDLDAEGVERASAQLAGLRDVLVEGSVGPHRRAKAVPLLLSRLASG
jgi:NAD(P)-dependent dehydrogenase (short-subunit alcohol dehydrogenase family)